jgi:hypothetical protein
MLNTSRRLVPWIPRLLGVLVSLFIGLFALDAFSAGKPFADAALDFLIHLLPALILLTVVALSWHREWLGALTFIGLALVYSTTMARGRLDWMLLIAAPLFIVGMLFLWSWLDRRMVRGT